MTMFEKLGGTDGIDQIVDDFYSIMATDPQAAAVFATHVGHDLRTSAQKLKAFLSGWTGGPPTYLETYGHPRLRLRHSSFQITQTEAREWLYCMKTALEKSPLPVADQLQLLAALESVTQMLINKS